jgi:large subunit ribosomal protein L35
MKLKTRKSAIKRVKVKKRGFARKKAYKSHLLRKKNSKRLRKLSLSFFVHDSDSHTFSIMIPYKK